MAKLVYIGFPSPLLKASCKEVGGGEEVEVTNVNRGICQDISAVPSKKGKYQMILEFEYDPSVLNNVSNINITSPSQEKQEETLKKIQDISALDLDVEGVEMKTNEDGSVSFRITGKDGEVTEVNADIPGMNVGKNDDGSISFSKPDEEEPAKSGTKPSTITRKTSRTTIEPGATFTSTRTTTTYTKTTTPSTETIVAGQMTIPRTQNIKIKLPCPKHHQENLKSACQAPDGSPVPVKCTVVDDDFVNLEFSPSGGNGTYSLNLVIGDKVFPGCPIQMEVKGL